LPTVQRGEDPLEPVCFIWQRERASLRGPGHVAKERQVIRPQGLVPAGEAQGVASCEEILCRGPAVDGEARGKGGIRHFFERGSVFRHAMSVRGGLCPKAKLRLDPGQEKGGAAPHGVPGAVARERPTGKPDKLDVEERTLWHQDLPGCGV
jgi:hypothetical protein